MALILFHSHLPIIRISPQQFPKSSIVTPPTNPHPNASPMPRLPRYPLKNICHQARSQFRGPVSSQPILLHHRRSLNRAKQRPPALAIQNLQQNPCGVLDRSAVGRSPTLRINSAAPGIRCAQPHWWYTPHSARVTTAPLRSVDTVKICSQTTRNFSPRMVWLLPRQ